MRGRVSGEKAEVGKGHITQGPVGPEDRFYSKPSGKPLEGFRQRNNMIWFAF